MTSLQSMNMPAPLRWVLIYCVLVAMSGCGEQATELSNKNETQIVGVDDVAVDPMVSYELEEVPESVIDAPGVVASSQEFPEVVSEDKVLEIRQQVSELDSALNANIEEKQRLKQRISSLEAQLAEMHRLANLEETD
jgi:hypothetical protein